MATLTEKTEQLAALKEAYYSGLLKVRTADGREITYRSGAELLEAISRLESEVNQSPRIHWFRLIPNRGGR